MPPAPESNGGRIHTITNVKYAHRAETSLGPAPFQTFDSIISLYAILSAAAFLLLYTKIPFGDSNTHKIKMEKRLSEAALTGNVSALVELLREDPLILDRTIVSCVSQTPLHISTILGHFDFVKHLLSHAPQLASELDSHGSSPLHLASAIGHLEILQELLSVDPDMCMIRDQDGRTPLHVAAIKARVKVLRELVRVQPESIRLLTDRGESVLHYCVRGNNGLEGLKVAVEAIGKDEELVNWKDCDGNTVLHIAVSKKQIETIKFLLTISGLDVNALNTHCSTALDILIQSPRDLRDMEIEDALRSAGVLSAKDVCLITHDWIPTRAPQLAKPLASSVTLQKTDSKTPVVKHKDTDWLGRKRSALMVVASLIATVAFQAGLTPPGGVWQDDLTVDDNGNPVEKPHTAGTSVMATNQQTEYGAFMILNTIAFLASLSIILLLVSGLPMRRRRWMWTQMVIMWIAITAQVLTYFLSLLHMSPDNVQGVLRKVLEISILTWLTLMVVVFIGNAIRVNLWVLRKYGYIKEKEVPSATIDDDDDGEDM